VAFARLELDQKTGTARYGRSGAISDLNRTVEDDQPGSLVDLMLGEALTDGKVEGDRAGRVTGGQDLRQPWLQVQTHELPTLHALSFGRCGHRGPEPVAPRPAGAREAIVPRFARRDHHFTIAPVKNISNARSL